MLRHTYVIWVAYLSTLRLDPWNRMEKNGVEKNGAEHFIFSWRLFFSSVL